MLRGLAKFAITILLLLILAIIIVYAGMQSRWGAAQISAFASKLTDYQISVGIVGHDLSSPQELILQDVSIKSANTNFMLDAKQITIEFNWRKLLSNQPIYRLTVTQGNLALTSTEQPINLSANILQFSNSRIHYQTPEHQILTTGLTGGITPWHSTPDSWLGYGDFRLTASSIKVDDNLFKKFALRGKYQAALTEISEISGELNHGFFIGSGKRTTDGSITIDSLAMSGMGWQSNLSFDQLLTEISYPHPIFLKNIDLINANFQGKDWAISGLNAEIQKLGVINGSWNTSHSKFELDASQLVIKNQQIEQLIASLETKNDRLNINKLSGYYEKGIFNLRGYWQRDNKSLTLDNVELGGLLYTLPEHWLSFFAAPAPDWLSNLSIKQFTLSQSLLMNINSDFPFEFTGLSGSMTDVDFIKHQQWGFWQGKASFSADSGTLNQAMLRRPSMEIRQSGQASVAATVTASTGQGVIKFGVLAKQQPSNVLFLLRSSGSNIDLSLLNQWGWEGLPREVIGDFDLTLQGNLLAKSIQNTLNGELVAIPLQGEKIYRLVDNGKVTAKIEAPESPTNLTEHDQESDSQKAPVKQESGPNVEELLSILSR